MPKKNQPYLSAQAQKFWIKKNSLWVSVVRVPEQGHANGSFKKILVKLELVLDNSIENSFEGFGPNVPAFLAIFSPVPDPNRGFCYYF